MVIIKATMRPGVSKNKWNSKIFTVIGANKSKANETHLLKSKSKPIKISKAPITFKM
jgi:hypothetical protein